MNLQRVAVVGTSGVGKSTFARQLGVILNQPHCELDSLYWNPGWRSTPEEEFLDRVSDRTVQKSWVIDGNYKLARRHIWSRATTLLWLNYPFPVTFGRLLSRTIRRSLSKEECCNGNQETLSAAFLSRESVLLWAITSHGRYKREYRLATQQYPNMECVELKSHRAAEKFLLRLSLSA